jgi:hypothetical protein
MEAYMSISKNTLKSDIKSPVDKSSLEIKIFSRPIWRV